MKAFKVVVITGTHHLIRAASLSFPANQRAVVFLDENGNIVAIVNLDQVKTICIADHFGFD